jgi:hypothetical protein
MPELATSLPWHRRHDRFRDGVLFRDDCMDAGGKTTQEAKAEYALHQNNDRPPDEH